MCAGVRGCMQMCAAMPQCGMVFADVHGCAQVFTGLCAYAWLFVGTGYAWVCMDVCGMNFQNSYWRLDS